jgi:uncharacterized protein (TIGR02996 family)
MNPTPESVEQAFLDDIVAAPDDASPWLILSDWLEDRADPRGELVRLTWQLQYEADHPDFSTRQARVQKLLAGGMVPVRPRRSQDSFELAWIAPGSFLMGSPKSEVRRDNDETQHPVTLTKGFWMGVYPITQAQWLAVMGENPSSFSRHGAHAEKVKRLRFADLARFPAEHMPWDATQQFCVRLGERLGKRCRLPTEAEWEYACRAGTTTPFHFGTVFSSKLGNAHHSEPYGGSRKGRSLGRPTLIGRYPANPWGLHDLHGNVWEWVQDIQALYPGGPQTDPLQTEGSESHVFRGGSWNRELRCCRAAYRDSAGDDYVSAETGLRVCLEA